MSESQSPVPPTRDDYLPLLNAFAGSRIDDESFERRFPDVYQNDESSHPEPMFEALDGVSWAVEDFYADPAPRDPGDLDEDQLRERVRAALATLQQILSPA